MALTLTHHETAIAFDAHVLSWSLDDNPPDEYARHHIKGTSFYGVDEYIVEMVILDSSPSMKIDFMAIQERGIYPAKKALLQPTSPRALAQNFVPSPGLNGGVDVKKERRKTKDGMALKFFEVFDDWVDERMEGKVDTLLLGCVAGVVVV